MALTVETGTGKTDADSYQSVDDYKAWADARGHDYSGSSDTEIEQALRRGTQYLENRYRGRWDGTKGDEDQALSWPRYNAFDEDGYLVDSNVVPTVVKHACNEAARRELETPNSLQPDLDRGGSVKRERSKVGPIEEETEYMDGASPRTVLTAIDDLLSGLTRSSSVNFLMRA